MTERLESSADERRRIGLTTRFTNYFTLNLEEKIRLAMDILHDVNDAWDHDKLDSYPDAMPSFDEYLADIGSKLYGVKFSQPSSGALHESPMSSDATLLGTLPFRSRQIDDPDANYDVSQWLSHQNLCEFDSAECDTLTGIYYGSAEDEVTKFCPRHFYEMHFGKNAAYRLVAGSGDRPAA